MVKKEKVDKVEFDDASEEEAVVEPDKKVDKAQEKVDKINRIKDEESRVFQALKFDDYENLVSNCYSEADVNVEMVLQKVSYGVIIEGKGGTGKTYRILNQAIKVLGDAEVKYVDSFTTPTALFVLLAENKDKSLIILDDVSGVFSNVKVLSMLKGALWHINDGHTRIVNYMTTKPPQDEYGEPLPRSIEINAGIIIITNFLNDDSPHVKAILSRVNRVRVDVPRKELLIILRQVIKKEHHGLSMVEKEEVLDYLEHNTTAQTEDLNIRTLLRMLDYRFWAKRNVKGDAWKTLCLKLLQRDDRLALVEKLVSDPTLLSDDDRIQVFADLTGESRATFYRLKAKLRKRNAVVVSSVKSEKLSESA